MNKPVKEQTDHSLVRLEQGYFNDEPSNRDLLKRHVFSEAMVNLAVTCDPPMTIGLFGTWGAGKTTFMRQIYALLSADYPKILTFWFNPWEYQFVQSPAVALLQVVVGSLESNLKRESMKLLSVIATALCNRIAKVTTGLKYKDILEIGKIYEGEHFLQQDENIRLKEYFVKIIENAKKDKDRLVFFIDDLDRCSPDSTFLMLEALKQYLNIDGCIYFLGLDRDVIIQTVKQKYEDLYKNESRRYVDYVDKIIQLPFNIPPIETEQIEDYIDNFLPASLHGCQKLLVAGLGKNPRQVKRFINILKLNYSLAIQQNNKEIQPQPLTILLMFQQLIPELYKKIINDPKIFIALKNESKEVKELIDKYLVIQSGLLNALNIAEIDEDIDLSPYIYLTKTISVAKVDSMGKTVDSENGDTFKEDLISQHTKWFDTYGKEGKRTVLRGADLSGFDFSNANLGKAIMHDTNLSEAKMENTDLFEASFRRSNLLRANILGGRLIKTSFYQANLTSANLSYCSIRDADFRDANLSSANFSEAIIVNSDFRGADLTRTMIDKNQLKNNRTDSSLSYSKLLAPIIK